jgi:15-cis-phytoene synthase/lycopene beta-cyclase
VLGLLLLTARPLLTRFDVFKLAFLVGMAFAAASPWDSWIIRKGVWSYPANSVVGTALDVPFEEYAFFLIRRYRCLPLPVASRPATAPAR